MGITTDQHNNYEAERELYFAKVRRDERNRIHNTIELLQESINSLLKQIAALERNQNELTARIRELEEPEYHP